MTRMGGKGRLWLIWGCDEGLRRELLGIGLEVGEHCLTWYPKGMGVLNP